MTTNQTHSRSLLWTTPVQATIKCGKPVLTNKRPVTHLCGGRPGPARVTYMNCHVVRPARPCVCVLETFDEPY